MEKLKITRGFHRLDFGARTYLLDTNVWSAIASSDRALNSFLPWLEENDAIAALSMFTIFELSRAGHKHKELDQLLTSAAQRIYIPLLYDELSDLEMSSYPNDVELLWNHITDYFKHDKVMIIAEISTDPRFVDKRQEFLEFGYRKFMNLESLKDNFPLSDDDGKFSVDSAETFAWANTLDYLLRDFPEYLLPFKGNLGAFDTSKLKSIYLRSLFLYFKYYVHGQTPNKSDFMDFANLSYVPYVDVYVTERNALNTLSHMKVVNSQFLKCDLAHIREFVDMVVKSSP